jgi:hypothetical protein
MVELLAEWLPNSFAMLPGHPRGRLRATTRSPTTIVHRPRWPSRTSERGVLIKVSRGRHDWLLHAESGLQSLPSPGMWLAIVGLSSRPISPSASHEDQHKYFQIHVKALLTSTLEAGPSLCKWSRNIHSISRCMLIMVQQDRNTNKD